MLHFFFLVFVTEISWQIALPASMVPNFSFAFFGMGIWYIIRYNHSNKNLYLRYLNIIISGLFMLALWSLTVILITKIVYSSFSVYVNEEILLNYMLVPGVFWFIILSLVFKMMLLLSEYAERKASEERLQKMLTETKLNALKAYINPHFLFNSLNSVNSLISHDPEKARKLLVNLSEYFRACIRNKDNGLVSLRDEIKNVFMYFDIEQERFADNIEYIEEIDQNCLEVELPPMILQPLFENIIKHAVAESTERIVIYFSVFRRPDDIVEISIKNTYDPDSIPAIKGEGLGLESCRRRFTMQFNRDDLFFVKKDEIYFTVIILVPEKE